MPENFDTRTKRVTAGVAVQHGAPAADDGQCGYAVKTAIPAADAARSARQTIAVGEAYNLVTHGGTSVPLAGLEAAVHGDLVYITEATNALSLAAGAGKLCLGQVSHLAGEQGGPTDRIRVDMDIKSKA